MWQARVVLGDLPQPQASVWMTTRERGDLIITYTWDQPPPIRVPFTIEWEWIDVGNQDQL